jgi:hypothetical protein
MGLDEHQCRVTYDSETVVRIYQPIDPGAYEAVRRGLPAGAFCENEPASSRRRAKRYEGSSLARQSCGELEEKRIEVDSLQPISSVVVPARGVGFLARRRAARPR